MKRRLMLLGIAVVVVMCMQKMYEYSTTTKLCRQIASGQTIDTQYSNGTNMPLWLNRISAILQFEGPKIPLVEACYYRNIQAVKCLLNNGADPNLFVPYQMTALEAALWNGPAGPIDEKSLEITKLLVDDGCNIDLYASSKPVIVTLAEHMIYGYSPIREDILLYLLSYKKTSVASEYPEVLFHMIRGGHTQMVTVLVNEYGFEINYQDKNGVTPLILAVTYSKESATVDMIRQLLELGANPTLEDSSGRTAIDYAFENNDGKILETLRNYDGPSRR